LAGGRPPASRAVHSFEDLALPPPAEIVLDTSFVVHALVATETLHAPARAYVEHLIESETTVYFNRLLELELAEVAFRLALLERFGKANVGRYRKDGRARRRAGRLLAKVTQEWERTLSSVRYVRIELEEVSAGVAALMRRYGLGSYDAVHAATAVHAQVTTMLTVDTGFALMPQSTLAIYTNATRVTICRGMRRRPSVTR
jgi:predicted nucleic acid-binding protein